MELLRGGFWIANPKLRKGSGSDSESQPFLAVVKPCLTSNLSADVRASATVGHLYDTILDPLLSFAEKTAFVYAMERTGFRPFILLHELGHQLSSITNFQVDAGQANRPAQRSTIEEGHWRMFLNGTTKLLRRGLVPLLVVIVVRGLAGGPALPALRGTVTDSEGAAVADAEIRAHRDPSGADVGRPGGAGQVHDATAKTDRYGRFRIELAPGFYDVFISAPAFSPTCRKIWIVPGKIGTYNVKLTADPFVTRQLGDKVSVR